MGVGRAALLLALLAPAPVPGQEMRATSGTDDLRLLEPLAVEGPSSGALRSDPEGAPTRLLADDDDGSKEWIGAATGGVVLGLLARTALCAGDDTEGCEGGTRFFLGGFAIGAILGAGIASAL